MHEGFNTQIAPYRPPLFVTKPYALTPIYRLFLASSTLRPPLLSSLLSLLLRALVNLLGIKTLSIVTSKLITLLLISSFKGSNLFLFLADKALALNSGSNS
jgi:hypothetical protein